MSDGDRPVYRMGSSKWKAIRRWGWYCERFFRLCRGEEMALPFDLTGYIWMAEEEPRLLEVMETIQSEARSRRSQKAKEAERGLGNRRKAPHTIAKR
jgi:hypothetical protein